MGKNKAQKQAEDTQAHALGAEQKSVLKKLKAGEITETEATEQMKALKAKYPLGVGVHPSGPPKETEQPKPAPAPPVAAAAPAQPSKQQVTLDKLKEAWTAKGVDLSKLEAKPDGKFLLITVAVGWPIIQLGPTGGIVLPQIRSYAKAFDAAIDGLALFEKQNARDQKKTATAAPAQPTAPAEKQTASA